MFGAVMSETGLPIISMMFESVSEGMTNTVINSVTTVVTRSIECSMSTELVVWHCHVMVWLAVKLVLNVMSFWESSMVSHV